MTEIQLKQYHSMITDIWKTFRKFSNIQQDDEWTRLMEMVRQLDDRYKNPICHSFLIEMVEELNRLNTSKMQ